MLFSDQNNQRVFNDVLKTISIRTSNSEFENLRNRHLETIIGSMLNHSKEWDSNCTINIQWIGGSFVSSLMNLNKESSKTSMDDLFSMCFRFLLEFYLSIKNELNHELEVSRRFAAENIKFFDEQARVQIEYAWRDMPISILKSLLSGEQFQSLKDFSQTIEFSKNQTIAWEKELEEREKRVFRLKENLEQYEVGFNFVGLHQGFDDLSIAKNKEKDNIKFWLNIMGCLIILPLTIEAILIWLHLEKIEQIRTALLISVIPTVSLAGILIFYFRVLLHNFNSAKSQILQIELRKTLCRFIQSYVVYAEKMGEKNQASLGKFEGIIFSGLVSSDDKLPSTFDGLEQLGALIKSLKK